MAFMMRVSRKNTLWIISVACFSCFIIKAGIVGAQAQGANADNSYQNRSVSIGDIEREINFLEAPIAAEKIGFIQQGISSQTEKEQVRLRKLLNDKMHSLYHPGNTTAVRVIGGQEENEDFKHNSIYQDLKGKIENLNVGADASIEDIKQKDAIVQEIANIQDPIVKYELIGLLEKKESSAQP